MCVADLKEGSVVTHSFRVLHSHKLNVAGKVHHGIAVFFFKEHDVPVLVRNGI